MTSLVWEAFLSPPRQQVSSSSAVLSSQAEPSQPVITGSTWEEYQQEQTHTERGTAAATTTQSAVSAHVTFPPLQNTWSLLLLSVSSSCHLLVSKSQRGNHDHKDTNDGYHSLRGCFSPAEARLFVLSLWPTHGADHWTHGCQGKLWDPPCCLRMASLFKESERVAGTQAGHHLSTVWHAVWQPGNSCFFFKDGIRHQMS